MSHQARSISTIHGHHTAAPDIVDRNSGVVSTVKKMLWTEVPGVDSTPLLFLGTSTDYGHWEYSAQKNLRRFITAFTTATTRPYPEPNRYSPRPHLSYNFKIYFNIILPPTPGSSKWSPFLRFPHQLYIHFSSPDTCYMPRPSQFSWFDHPTDISCIRTTSRTKWITITTIIVGHGIYTANWKNTGLAFSRAMRDLTFRNTLLLGKLYWNRWLALSLYQRQMFFGMSH
jgi:hypothetical protein